MLDSSDLGTPFARNRFVLFWTLISDNKLLLAACVATFVLLAATYLHFAKYVYEVNYQVTPVAQPASSGLSGNLQNLASLAGFALPSNADSGAFQLYLAGLQSRFASDTLAKDAALMKMMFPQDWSDADNGWREPKSFTISATDFVKSSIGIPVTPWEPPSGRRVQDFLTKEITINKTRTSPIVTVSIDTASPDFGVVLLRALHKAVDNSLRQRSLKRSEDNIAYLTAELNRVSVADYREALASVLADQEKQRMMASSTIAFVAEPFGDPVVSERPVSPKALPIFTLMAFLGLVTGLLIAAWKDRRKIGLPSLFGLRTATA